MGILLQHDRQFKSITDPIRIGEIITKYTDLENYFVTSPFMKKPVIHLAHPEENSLIITFSEPNETDHVTLYTLVKDRYLEIHIKITDRDQNPKICSAIVEKIRIAAQDREHPRYEFETMKPHADTISIPKYNESEKDLKNSILLKIIVKEYLAQLPEYPVKDFFTRGDADIPAEVQFVMATGVTLFMVNISKWEKFLSDNEAFFNTVKLEMLKERLEQRFRELSRSHTSLLIRPLEYQTLTGEIITIAYLRIIKNGDVLDLDELSDADDFASAMNDRLRNGNLVTYPGKGDITNLSSAGACFYIKDAELIKNIAGQESILINLNLKYEEPIKISGRLIHIQTIDSATARIGIRFKGSYYGPDLARKIDQWYAKNFDSEKK